MKPLFGLAATFVCISAASAQPRIKTHASLRSFAPDAAKLRILRPCIDNHSVGSPREEWPNNLLSRKTVVYGSGRIARAGQSVRHNVSRAELTLCQRLSAAAKRVVGDMEVGMGSESSDAFQPFFIAANQGEAAPRRIDPALIRRAFGGTIFPLATITVEPLRENGIWWREVQADGSESPPSYFAPWRKMIAWFGSQKASKQFIDVAFVRIGDYAALQRLHSQKLPQGTVMPGAVMPRLALGLTRNGSLVGLFGFSVQP